MRPPWFRLASGTLCNRPVESCLSSCASCTTVRPMLNSRVCGVSQTDLSMVRSHQVRLGIR